MIKCVTLVRGGIMENKLINERITYLSIIFNHLDRLSMLITQNAIEFNSEGGSIKLDIAINFLINLIPTNLKDDNYYQNVSAIKDCEGGRINNSLKKIRCVIDLLNRRDLLFNSIPEGENNKIYG